MIKVLWVDDQHLMFTDFKDNAKDAGITLISVDNKYSAEDKLEKETFDAVILDANFKKSENDEIGPIRNSSIVRGFIRISQKLFTDNNSTYYNIPDLNHK